MRNAETLRRIFAVGDRFADREPDLTRVVVLESKLDERVTGPRARWLVRNERTGRRTTATEATLRERFRYLPPE